MSSTAGLKKHYTTINTSSNPHLPTPAIQISQDEVCQVFQKQKREKNTSPRLCYTSLSEILCWPAGPHLHKDLQQITGTVRSALILQTLRYHPHPKEIQNYRTSWLHACCSNVRGHEVIWKTGAGPPKGRHWTLIGSSSVCLQSKQVCGRCSQHGNTLCSATTWQTRDLCEDPVCGLQLGL